MNDATQQIQPISLSNSSQNSEIAAKPQKQSAKQAAQQNNQQQQRRGPQALKPDEAVLLDTLLKRRLQQPGAARELLTALQNQGSRFYSFRNGMANQMFRVLQDVDRIFSDMDRGRDAISVEAMTKRHDLEKRLGLAVEALVDLAGEAVLTSNTRKHLIQSAAVREAARKAGVDFSEEKSGRGNQKQAA